MLAPLSDSIEMRWAEHEVPVYRFHVCIGMLIPRASIDFCQFQGESRQLVFLGQAGWSARQSCILPVTGSRLVDLKPSRAFSTMNKASPVPLDIYQRQEQSGGAS